MLGLRAVGEDVVPRDGPGFGLAFSLRSLLAGGSAISRDALDERTTFFPYRAA